MLSLLPLTSSPFPLLLLNQLRDTSPCFLLYLCLALFKYSSDSRTLYIAFAIFPSSINHHFNLNQHSPSSSRLHPLYSHSSFINHHFNLEQRSASRSPLPIAYSHPSLSTSFHFQVHFPLNRDRASSPSCLQTAQIRLGASLYKIGTTRRTGLQQTRTKHRRLDVGQQSSRLT